MKRTSPNAALFGMESVVGDDTVRHFFKSVDPVRGTEWIARNIKPTKSTFRGSSNFPDESYPRTERLLLNR